MKTASDKRYGIKIEYKDGTIVYYGKGLSPLNTHASKMKTINGTRFKCEKLDNNAILKNGYKTKMTDDQLVNWINTNKYGHYLIQDAKRISIVELKPSIEEMHNFDSITKTMEKISNIID